MAPSENRFGIAQRGALGGRGMLARAGGRSPRKSAVGPTGHGPGRRSNGQRKPTFSFLPLRSATENLSSIAQLEARSCAARPPRKRQHIPHSPNDLSPTILSRPSFRYHRAAGCGGERRRAAGDFSPPGTGLGRTANT